MNDSTKEIYRNLAKFKGAFETSNAFFDQICYHINCSNCEFSKRPCLVTLKTLQPDAIAFVRAEKLNSLLS